MEYPTIRINGITWLAKNFNLLLEGIPVNPGNSTNPAQYYPRDDYRDTYGMLYNGAAAEYIEENKATICPGWHVPTKNEFDNLINFFNGVEGLCKILCASNYNHGIGDMVGYNILPGGNWDKDYQRFEYEGQNAYLISIDKDSNNNFYHVSTTNSNIFMFGSTYGHTSYANNLRLVKDAT